jgi:small redox-active disulfide protein 2
MLHDDRSETTEESAMKKIQILGVGCPKCKKLSENAVAAAEKLGIEYDLEKVTEIDRIIDFGVMMTPALVVDGKVMASGSIPSKDEIEKMLASDKAGEGD